MATFALAAGLLATIVPSGFLPEEHQGAFFVEVQLPDAASLNRTTAVVAQVENMIQGRPWTQSVLTVAGYSLIDGLALANKALAVVRLKPFDERTDKSLSVFSALAEVNPLFQEMAGGNVIAFNLPPISSLGNAAGFELQLQTLTGATPKDLAAVADGLVIAANQNPALANGASTPQVYLKLDRERAETLESRLATYSAHCRPRWAARMSMTSIALGAPGRSRFRSTRQIARRSKISFECACAPPRVISSRCARSPMSS